MEFKRATALPVIILLIALVNGEAWCSEVIFSYSTPALLRRSEMKANHPSRLAPISNRIARERRHDLYQKKSSTDYGGNDDDIDMYEAFKDISRKLEKAQKEVSSEDQPKLGIEIGKMLDPLSEKEAAELKAAATEIINDAYAEGLDEIEKLRKRMEAELAAQRRSSELKSEFNTKQETEKLMQKIDSLTSSFLKSTETVRTQTKLAATADQTNSQMTQGIEWGAWGSVDGVTVQTTAGIGVGTGTLLGSVESAKRESMDSSDAHMDNGQQKRIVVVADENQDMYAKEILPLLTKELQAAIPSLDITVYKPTATLPLGGDNAACVVMFLTSLSDPASIRSAADRLLRKTMLPNGGISHPPTQLVAISTVGTERFNKIPYSMQNMMGGGKIEKRRQMEEAIVKIVRERTVAPALDYTIVRLGEIKNMPPKSGELSFNFSPFDTLDGSIDLSTAVLILSQAIAIQPAARNATLSCVGTLPLNDGNLDVQEMLDDWFVRLEGPEIVRFDLLSDENTSYYDELVEYIREWAFLLAETGKGLTTPIRAIVAKPARLYSGIVKQACIQLLFLPTNTGRNYLSKEEENERREQPRSSNSPSANTGERMKATATEGGIEFLIEVTSNNDTRLRVRRCNYSAGAIIKELSEETIISRFKKSVEVWKTRHSM